MPRIFLVLALAGLMAGCGSDASSSSASAGTTGGDGGDGGAWVGAWAAAPYGPYPIGPISAVAGPLDPLAATTLSLFPDQQSHDQSFRMIVHPTLGGSRLRIRLSNLRGDRTLTFSSIQVARRMAGAALVPGTATPVSFGSADAASIPAGAEAISDAVPLSFSRGDDLAISFHVAGDSGPMTWHAVSFGLNFVGPPGVDVAADPSGATFAAQPTLGWFFVSGVDVPAEEAIGSIVALGDSITDGAFEVPETNTRWPDFLSSRLAAQGIVMGVLNQGINSNTVTGKDNLDFQGPPAVLRFERDVLQRSGVRSLVILEGTNDLSGGVKADVIYAGLLDLVGRAQAAGLCVVLGTVMPRDDVLIYGWDRATMESERQALNNMIRATPGIEGIADFDAAMGNRLDPTHINPAYYFPDLLHPNTLGFSVMANAVPLEALVPPPAGRCAR